ncbi:DUF1700 domain-containing protein [Paenibacillus oleatilyticus]|uniref:DUF1700 domain-containing protein n=1 Tax=Paenibacillus oleatilyticus TaxID=2594886 RepID=UPI001C1FA38A|nr:DUF1700 domain-containing protein [Paenibacillus oleatilyticus]MBU7314777.1 DUF1700 domain-containing protein [Paenibacillus oleatilyticus]
MSPKTRAYLEKLYQLLEKMPEDERLDAIREIESHIAEGMAGGQSEDAILARLGDPRVLAKAYRSEYIMEKGPARSFKDVMIMVGFYCTTGLLSIMVIPVLATLAGGFGFSAVLVFIAGLLRTLGVTGIQMNLGPVEVPTEWSMVVSTIVGGIVGGIAYVSWRGLRLYMSFLSASYKKVLPGRRAM